MIPSMTAREVPQEIIDMFYPPMQYMRELSLIHI